MELNKKVKSGKNRLLLILAVVLLSFVFIYNFISSKKSQVQEDNDAEIIVGRQTEEIKATPGLNDDAEYNKLQEEQNKINYEQAKSSGESYIPKLVSNKVEDDGFDLSKMEVKEEPKVEEPPKEPVVEEVVKEPEPIYIPPVIEEPKVEEKKVYKYVEKTEDKNQQLIDNYVAQLNDLYSVWRDDYYAVSVPFVEKTNFASMDMVNPFSGNNSNAKTSENLPSVEASSQEKNNKIIIGAGTIISGVLLTAINTDEPGPVLAQIVGGPLDGARLIGAVTNAPTSVTDPTQKVTIQFRRIRMPGSREFSIDAYAIDPNTSRTALASDVNNHYFRRYGLGLAAAFIEGLGDGFAKSINNTTVNYGNTAGTDTVTTVTSSETKNIVRSSLGSMGRKLGREMDKISDVPATIKVNAYEPIGILFMSDF